MHQQTEPETIMPPAPGTTEIEGHAVYDHPKYGKIAYLFVGITIGMVFGSFFGSWCATSANVGSLTKHDVLQMAADSYDTQHKLQYFQSEQKNKDAYQDTWIRNMDKAIRDDRTLNRNNEYRLSLVESELRRLMSDRADEQIKEEMEAKK